MDRSATCLFGIRNYGVDINGYVKHPDKGLCLWFQKRSATKQTWPGKKWLDILDTFQKVLISSDELLISELINICGQGFYANYLL